MIIIVNRSLSFFLYKFFNYKDPFVVKNTRQKIIKTILTRGPLAVTLALALTH